VPMLAGGGGGADDQDLRRRRREAVVIHDGDVDRPIGQEDVYMRDEAGQMDVGAVFGQYGDSEMEILTWGAEEADGA
jgi:hypothetical protein